MPGLVTLEGAFDSSIRAQVNQALQTAGLFTTGNIYYLDCVNGSNNNSGLAPSSAVASLAAGYALLTSGHNDVLILIGNGATTSTARLGSAFTWAKNAAHLIGVTAPVYFSSRARIAPTTGATAFANLFNITGVDCLFQNIQWFDGFGTGTTAQICMKLTGAQRCVFQGCHIAGMGDNESAQSSTSRSLSLIGASENVFRRCVIGLDTITRTTTNASVDFVINVSTKPTRNVFEDCIFPALSSSAGALFVTTTAIDRFQIFERCKFYNAVNSTATTMTAVATLGAATGGGLIFKDCALIGITGFGTDATSRGQIWIEGGAVAAATTGLAVAPTA